MNSGQEETEGHSLSKAILAGDPNAWGEFLSEYGDALRRVAEKHSRSAKLQSVVSWEDIFQGFFTDKLIAHKEGMFSATSRGEVPLKPRLLASLGNYCNDLYRRKLTLRNESTLDARVSQKAVDVFHYDEPRLIRRRIAEQQLAIRSTFQQNLRIQVPQQEILLLQERIWIAEQFAAFYCKGSDSKSEKDQFALQCESLYPFTESEADVRIPESNEPLSNVWHAIASALVNPPFCADALIVANYLRIPRNTWTKWVGRARKQVVDHIGIYQAKEFFPNWPSGLFAKT